MEDSRTFPFEICIVLLKHDADSYGSYLYKNLLKLVFRHTSLGYKGLNIDPFKRIESRLRNNNFLNDTFCTHQNTVFIYRYSTVAWYCGTIIVPVLSEVFTLQNIDFFRFKLVTFLYEASGRA